MRSYFVFISFFFHNFFNDFVACDACDIHNHAPSNYSAHGYSVYNAYAPYNPVSRRDSELASLSSGRTDSDTMSISSMSTWVDRFSFFVSFKFSFKRLKEFSNFLNFHIFHFTVMDDHRDEASTIIIKAQWSGDWFGRMSLPIMILDP